MDTETDWWIENLEFNIYLMLNVWIIADVVSAVLFWMGTILGKIEKYEEKMFGNNRTNSSTSDFLKKFGTAGISKFNEVVNEKYQSAKPQVTHTGQPWICPSCGRENQSYVGTCGCGQRKA